jgi:hypothetical protein
MVRNILGPELCALVDQFACGGSMFGKAGKLKSLVRRAKVMYRETICVGDEVKDLDAAEKAGGRDSVVGSAKRGRLDQASLDREGPGDGVDLRHLDRFRAAERGQDGRKTAREHGLAGPGRAHEEHVVAAGRGDLERAPRHRLAFHVPEVADRRVRRRRGRRLRRDRPRAARTQYAGVLHNRGLGGRL